MVDSRSVKFRDERRWAAPVNGARNVVQAFGALVPNESPTDFLNVVLDFSRPPVLSMIAKKMSGKDHGAENVGVEAVDNTCPEHLSSCVASSAGHAFLMQFCSVFPAWRVEPTVAEMDVALVNLSFLDCDEVVAAFYHHLTLTPGDNDWQACLRAVCLLEYFYWQNGIGRALACAVVDEASALLTSLREVPQCHARVAQLLDLAIRPQPCPDGNSSYALDEWSDIDSELSGHIQSSSCSTAASCDDEESIVPVEENRSKRFQVAL